MEKQIEQKSEKDKKTKTPKSRGFGWERDLEEYYSPFPKPKTDKD